jgi:hypothetical protein
VILKRRKYKTTVDSRTDCGDSEEEKMQSYSRFKN